MAIGVGVSPLGFGVDLTTNFNRHLNLRVSGSRFTQPVHISTNEFNANAQLKLASAGAFLDLYPFHTRFRVSPGLLFYNQNRATATDTIASGTALP